MHTFSESPVLRTDLPLEFSFRWSASENLPHGQHPHHDSFQFLFSSKHVAQYATELPDFHPATSSSFLNTEQRIQRWFVHVRQVYLVFSKQEEHVCWDLPAILFQLIKTSCVRMTKIGNEQNSG